MAKKIIELTPEEKKEIEILKAANKMLDETAKESAERGKNESVELINEAKNENFSKMAMINPEIAKAEMIKDKQGKLGKEEYETDTIKIESKTNSVFDMMDKINNDSSTDLFKEIDNSKYDKVKEYMENKEEELEKENYSVDYNDIPETSDCLNVDNGGLQYDVIPLPSNGQCYKNKVDRIAVSYLTAESEDLIMSPNLYHDDMIIDALLKYHVLNKNINTDNLIQGDIDAIILWLRATGYGPEYPVRVKDPSSNEEFNSIVDLSKIKMKDFKLKGDKNGFFDFTLPISKKEIKFKFLTRKEERILKKINQYETNDVRHDLVKKSYDILKGAFTEEKNFTIDEKKNISSALDNIKMWVDKTPKETKFNHIITNRLELMIQEIDGNSDKTFIKDFIKKMPALDSIKFRRYIDDNEPGVNWNVTVERPESLGGGSFELFLEWSTDAFLNIA